jgi:hypothetical protein
MADIAEERRGSQGSTPPDVEKAIPLSKVQTEDEFPSLKKLVFIMLAIYLSMFLVALVSIPKEMAILELSSRD